MNDARDSEKKWPHKANVARQKGRANRVLGAIIHHEVLSRPVVRSLAIAGEATRNIPIAQRLHAFDDAMQRLLQGLA